MKILVTMEKYKTSAKCLSCPFLLILSLSSTKEDGKSVTFGLFSEELFALFQSHLTQLPSQKIVAYKKLKKKVLMDCFAGTEDLGILNGMRQRSNAFDNLGKTALTILLFSNQFLVELIHFL